MGIRTDLTSLGAIGLGTAVAVVGTGALLYAGASHHVDASVCVDVPTVTTLAAAPAPPTPPTSPEAPVVVAEISVDATPGVPLPTERADVADAPEAPKPHRVSVVVSDRIEVRTECVAKLDREIVELRVRANARAEAARAQVDAARARADEARALADRVRAQAEAIRAEARASGEVDPDRIQELVETALAEAGLHRDGARGR